MHLDASDIRSLTPLLESEILTKALRHSLKITSLSRCLRSSWGGRVGHAATTSYLLCFNHASKEGCAPIFQKPLVSIYGQTDIYRREKNVDYRVASSCIHAVIEPQVIPRQLVNDQATHSLSRGLVVLLSFNSYLVIQRWTSNYPRNSLVLDWPSCCV